MRSGVFAGRLLCAAALLSALCSVLWPGAAAACATCSVGDRTLTSMGAAQPYANRVRLSLTARHRYDAIGTEGVDGLQLRELRLDLAAAYSPADWLTLSVLAPLVRRDVRFTNLARSVSWNLGDIELNVRGVLYRDRRFAPRHLVSAMAGLKAPTAPARRDPFGQLLPLELQAGTGSWDPSLGVTHAFFADPWSTFISSILTLPTAGFGGSRGGVSWRTVANVQLQPSDAFGIRAGAMLRVDAVARETRQEGQGVEPDSGGAVVYATMGAVVSPATDVIIQANLAVPVVNALRGQHDEGLAVSLGVALDL